MARAPRRTPLAVQRRRPVPAAEALTTRRRSVRGGIWALRRDERILGAAGAYFLVVLFFVRWYGGSASSTARGLNFNTGFSGWETFTTSRWIWLAAIVAAGLSVAVGLGAVKVQSRARLSVITTTLGALSVLTIAYRIAHHPHGASSFTIPGAAETASYSYGIRSGIWLGLAAAVLITWAGFEAMRAEGVSLGRPGGAGRGTSEGPAEPPAPRE